MAVGFQGTYAEAWKRGEKGRETREGSRIDPGAGGRGASMAAVGKQMSELLKTASKLTPTFCPGTLADISVTKYVGGFFFFFLKSCALDRVLFIICLKMASSTQDITWLAK